MGVGRQSGRMTIHQQLVREVALRILSGEIAPGEILSTENIASAEMDVSRTAYREAVKVLTAKGFLESRPKIGTRVREKSNWNILDQDVIAWKSETESTTHYVDGLFEFRQIIEPEAAFLAAQNATPEMILRIREAVSLMEKTDPAAPENFEADIALHRGILEASCNEFLGFLGHVVETLLLKSFELSAQGPGAREGSVPLHMAVVAHIENGEAEQARDAMSVLLGSARKDLDKVLASARTATDATERRPME